jgi:O-antigen/teichoic acid export membrane protein
MFLGPVFLALIVAVFFYIFVQLLPGSVLNSKISSLLYLVAILIVARCANEILLSFIRSEQRTKLYNSIAIIRRYGSLVLSIFFVFFFLKGLYGFYFGQVLSALIIFCVLLYSLAKKQEIGLTNFSGRFFKRSIRFGFPLSWSEIGHLVLNYADRYMIQYYLGSTMLGLYTAGYNLATYVTQFLIYPINYALEPIYMSMFVHKGEQETKEFFSKVLRYYLVIMIPAIFGFIAVGRDLISFLASNKYIESSSVLSYVVIGQAIYSCHIILNVGLFIREKTHLVMIVKIAACIVNIFMNLFLIPRYGITGAAQATLVSYVFYTILITYYAFKEFSFRIEYERILLYLGLSLVMFVFIKNIDFGLHLINLISRVGIGVLVYSLLVFAFDGQIRRNCIGAGMRLINKSGRHSFSEN